MARLMAKIKVRNIQNGMILASDVSDQNGMLIASQGLSISEKHLRTFKSWGITEIDIEIVEEEKVETCVTAKNESDVSAEVNAEVVELFRYTDTQHPAMVELRELCILRKMESL